MNHDEAKRKLKELFMEMELDEFIDLWQQYCEEISDYDRILYSMSSIEDFLYDIRDAGYSLSEIIEMVTDTSFHLSDIFFMRNKNNKLVSYSYSPFEVKDFAELANYLVDVDRYAVESDAVDEILSEMED